MKKILFVTFSILCYLTSQCQIITTVAGGGSTEGLLAINSPVIRPSNVAVDAFGNLYFAVDHRIKKVNASTGIMSTIAGNGTIGYGGDGNLAVSAILNQPSGIALDSSGNLYFADLGNNRIRKINTITGIISTIAGNGTSGFGGDGAAATAAFLSYPSSVAVDLSGNIYIADTYNGRIRKIAASTGIISTIAGNGTSSGYGYYAINTSIAPDDLAIDNSGNLFIVETFNHRIWKVNLNTGIIYRLAGNGKMGNLGDGGAATDANLWYPHGVTVDSSGNLFIADFGNNKIRKVNANTGIITTLGYSYISDSIASIVNPLGVTMNSSGDLYISSSTRIFKLSSSTGIVSALAGTGGTGGYAGDGSAANTSCLNNPNGIVVDTLGNLFIADFNNHRIRKVNANNGVITTIAGTGKQGYSGDSSNANIATFRNPISVALDRLGNLFITDQGNGRIRKVTASTGIISTVAGSGKFSYGGDGGAATVAYINYPTCVTLDSSSNLLIAEGLNNRIRKVNASTGIISTVAGNGNNSTLGDSGSATSAFIKYPKGVSVDVSGNIYIADYFDHRIRKVNANTGIITTVAGNGESSENGDGGPATAAKLFAPSSVAVDGLGNLYIASNNKIRKVNVVTGIISTVAGNGIPGFSGDGALAKDANLSDPTGLNFDKLGNLYIADFGNNRIRKIMYFNYIITSNQTICLGKNPDSLIANIPFGGNGTYNYTWLKSTTSAFSGFTAIPASNSVNYKPTAITQNTWYRRYVVTGTQTDTSAAVLITVNQNPNPRVGFIINKATQCLVGNNFSFTDTSSALSGTITRKWNLGTGVNDTSLQLNPNKVYASPNTYAVKLIITSNNGCKDSVTKTVTVITKPTTNFNINNISQCLKNNYFVFTNQSTLGFNYLWKFGNGDTSTITSPTYSYTNDGVKAVKLIVSDNNNCMDSITKTITIITKPATNFAINNISQCLKNNYFVFTNQSAPGFNYLWKFGNGDTATTVSPTYSYPIDGIKIVKLIVSDNNNNCIDSITKSIVVNPQPIAAFSINNPSQCLNGNNFLFTDNSNITSGTLNRLWLFSNGDTSTNASANKSYFTVGTFGVKLTVKSDKNCIDTLSKTVTVTPKLIIGNILGNTNPTSTINPYSYSVLNQANVTYNWTATNGTIQSGQGTNVISVVWANAGVGSINAKITNTNNCSDTTNLAINLTKVGINNLSLDNDLNTYPNPTKASITITNKTNLIGKKYIITNLVGQTVITGKLNLDETVVNLESLQSGMYFLSIDGLNKQSIKVIKE